MAVSYTHLDVYKRQEHGGGNNSTFTTRVVTSSGSDTYSAVAAAMSSLKGPRHGGANIKVMEMMDDIREHVDVYKRQIWDITNSGRIIRKNIRNYVWKMM